MSLDDCLVEDVMDLGGVNDDGEGDCGAGEDEGG